MDSGLEGARSWRARGGGDSRTGLSGRRRDGMEYLGSGCAGDVTRGAGGDGEEPEGREGPLNWDMKERTRRKDQTVSHARNLQCEGLGRKIPRLRAILVSEWTVNEKDSEHPVGSDVVLCNSSSPCKAGSSETGSTRHLTTLYFFSTSAPCRG